MSTDDNTDVQIKKKNKSKLPKSSTEHKVDYANGSLQPPTPSDIKPKKRKKLRDEPEETKPAETALPQPDGLKTKKKKKKAHVEAPESQAATLQAVPSSDGAKEAAQKEQKKKKRKQEAEQQGGQPVLAAVGDLELARSSKPVHKALYSEHADVRAFSDDWVNEWRSQRQTVVTGSDLRPVPEFHQAGVPMATCLHRITHVSPIEYMPTTSRL